MAKRPKLTTAQKIARTEKLHKVVKEPWYRKTKKGVPKRYKKLSMF